MGALTNSVFQMLLGWVRELSVEVWNTASDPERPTILSVIGAHWIEIALVLCGAGLIIDLIVYLFRWQPYRVWGSFFRRLRRGKKEAPEEAEDGWNRSVSRADRTAGAENAEEEAPERARRRFREDEYDAEPEEDAEAPNRPTAWQRTEPEGTTAAFEQAILPARRRRVTRLFTDRGEEELAAPNQLIDERAAYRRPVYPRSWKTEEADRDET